MSNSDQQRLLGILHEALSIDKPTRERGEGMLKQALGESAPTVLPLLVQIAGDASLGPASVLAAVTVKNYLGGFEYEGQESAWDDVIVPNMRPAVLAQIPASAAASRRLLLESLRMLCHDNPWPEVVDLVAPHLRLPAAAPEDEAAMQQLQHRVACALEVLLIWTTRFKLPNLVQLDMQHYAAETILPLLPPLFSLGRTEIVLLVLKVFECCIATTTPPSFASNPALLESWHNEMLSFPEKFFAVSQQSKELYRHYIKCVKRIVLIATNTVAFGPPPSQRQSRSRRGGGGGDSTEPTIQHFRRGHTKVTRFLPPAQIDDGGPADGPPPPKIYGYAAKFTLFFAHFIHYVATTTATAIQSHVVPAAAGGGASGSAADPNELHRQREIAEMLREPASFALRFLRSAATRDRSTFQGVDMRAFVTEDLFCFMLFTPEDEELWDMDPREYLRQMEDPCGQEFSLRHSAMNLIAELCRAPRAAGAGVGGARSRSGGGAAASAAVGGDGSALVPLADLLSVMSNRIMAAHVQQQSAEQQQQQQSSPKELMKNADAAIFVIAQLGGHIRRDRVANCWPSVGAMLTSTVAPLLQHPSSVLRAKAVWICGVFSRAPFSDPATFGDMVFGVMQRIEDDHPAVRSAVVTSVVQFIAQPRARPLVHRLLTPIVDECVRLLEATSSERVVLSLQCLIQCFGPELRSKIADISDSIVQSVLAVNFELQSMDMNSIADDQDDDDFVGDMGAAGAGGGGDGGGVDEETRRHQADLRSRFDSLSSIVVSSLKTLAHTIEAMGANAMLIRQIQPRVGQMVLELLSRDDEAGYLEYTLSILALVLRYSIVPGSAAAPGNASGSDGAAAPELWNCLPVLHRLVQTQGHCELFSAIVSPIDNFVGLFPDSFRGGANLGQLLQTCRYVLGLVNTDFIQHREIGAAASLLSSLLEHVQHQVGRGSNANNQQQQQGGVPQQSVFAALPPASACFPENDGAAFDEIVDMLVQTLLTASRPGNVHAKAKGAVCVALLDCFIVDAARIAGVLEARYGGANGFLMEFCRFYRQKNAKQFAGAIRSKVVVLGLLRILRVWMLESSATPSLEGCRALLEVVVHATRAARKAHEEWLADHTDDKINRHDGEEFEDDDEDEGDGGGEAAFWNHNESDNSDGGDDDGDAGDQDENSDNDNDEMDEVDEDEYQTPIDAVNEAAELALFLTQLPGSAVQALDVGSLITEAEVQQCVDVANAVVARDLQLQEMLNNEEESRAAAWQSSQQNQ